MASPQRIERNGRTLYRVQIRKPTKGLRIDEYFSTKRAAEQFLRRVEHNLDQGEAVAEVSRSRETLAEVVAKALEDPAAFATKGGRPLKPSYVKDRRERLRYLARPHRAAGKLIDLGAVHIRRLAWRQIDNALAALATEHGWNTRTRYQYEVALSRLFEYSRARGWITVNPVKGQDRFGGAGARKRIYSDAEWTRLLAAADARGDMLGMFLRLARATGCRKSELLRLRWMDITPLDDPALGAEIEVLATKNHQDRVVFISKAVHELLEAHRRQYQTNESPRVFPGQPRGCWRPDPAFREARAAAGLDRPDERYGEVLSMHHIRHTWATHLGASGATLAELMAAGGWKTATMATRYMKPQRQQAREAALRMVQQ